MEFKIEELKKKNNCFEINEKTAKDIKNQSYINFLFLVPRRKY